MEKDIYRKNNKIDKNEYCIRVSELCNQNRGNIIPEQIKEALGSIANLYYYFLVDEEREYLKVKTDHTLTSSYVSHEDINQIIGYATGIGKRRCDIVQDALENCFLDHINENIEDHNTIYFEPFGLFKIKNKCIDDFELYLFYTHPNSKYFKQFLLEVD